jgi:hypothetical protein
MVSISHDLIALTPGFRLAYYQGFVVTPTPPTEEKHLRRQTISAAELLKQGRQKPITISILVACGNIAQQLAFRPAASRASPMMGRTPNGGAEL